MEIEPNCPLILGFGCITTSTGCGLILTIIRLNTRLAHQVIEVVLQIIDAIAHLVYSAQYLVRHGLKFILHVLQERLHLSNEEYETAEERRREKKQEAID